jgi:HEAT repeat protein
MSEADDKRELSGLARSIDALFSGAAHGGAAAEKPADEVRSEEAFEPEWEAGGLAQPPTEQQVPAADEPAGFAADEPAGFAADEPAGFAADEPMYLVAEAPAGLAAAEPMDFTADEPVAAAYDDEPAGFALPGPPLHAGTAAEPDPDDFERAIDDFLAGEPGSAARVGDLAAELRERLALDPLADAAERLAHAAGDPPDPTLVEMGVGIMNPAVASRIVQRIGHERDDARKAEYATVCRRLGEIMAKAFRGALTDTTDTEVRRTYQEMMIAMGGASRPIIEGMVDDENGLLVRSAVAMLGDMGGERAVELVVSALANPDARVRREALLSMAKLGDEESAPLVLASMEDPDPDVRLAAATAAGALEVDRALRPLLAMLEAEADPDRLQSLIRALGALGDPGAVPAIEKHAVRTLFSKPPTEVRVEAYRALHRIGSPHARDLVQQALSDKDVGLRAAVRRIVGSAGPK